MSAVFYAEFASSLIPAIVTVAGNFCTCPQRNGWADWLG